MLQDIVDKRIKMRPEDFFAQITAGPTGDTYDAGIGITFTEDFQRLGVIIIHLGVKHLPGKQVHLADLRVLRQSSRQFDYIFGLSAGIRITAQFQVVATNQPMYADQHDVQAIRRIRHSLSLSISG